MDTNKVKVATISELEDQPDGRLKDVILDFIGSFNKYATRKTAGQGLLDFALLAANISKLQDLFRRKGRDTVFYVLATIICISIVLQLVVGLLMAIIGRMNLRTETDRKRADFLNNLITVLLAIISLVNVVISVTDVSSGGGGGDST